MNLIVDGKIVRTATGKGTPNLTDASFDVSEFVGKKAHIEIVDATASADRGYIMVDDMAFVAKCLLSITEMASCRQLLRISAAF